MDDISDIQALYDNNVERERSRMERHPVEHDVTWCYLDKYLPPSGKILEVGAGPGNYTIDLARKGYKITATDLSPSSLEECRQRICEENFQDTVTCTVADARDLSAIEATDYDAVLLMGPLYHLIHEEDRKSALREAFRKLKPGGLLFSAFISRFGIWAIQLGRRPEAIEYSKDIDLILESGHDPKYSEWDGRFRAYFTTVPEIAPLHEQIGFRTLTIAGVEPIGAASDENYKNLPEHQRKLWLDLMFRISAEPSIIGASCHILYIGKKPL